jgi:CBS domain-containing protein
MAGLVSHAPQCTCAAPGHAVDSPATLLPIAWSAQLRHLILEQGGATMAKKALKKVRFARASDVMHTDIVYIEGKKTVADAVRLMRDKRVSSLIVKRRGHEDAFGIVTRKDVVNKVVDPGKDPAQVKVFEIMSKPLITVSPGLALKYCARLFNAAGVRRAVVFDGKEIVGMLSNTDIFNAIEV